MQNQIHEDHCCSICLTLYYDPVLLKKCKHCFCRVCIEESTEYTDQKKCPLCRDPFVLDELIPEQKLKDKIQALYPDELKEKAKSIRQRLIYKVKVGNRTLITERSINKYEWTLYVEPAQGEPPLAKYAEKVEIYLHPTFHPNLVVFPATKKIQITKNGWGTFRIDIKIIWKKEFGGFTQVYHDLNFDPKTEKVLNCKILSQFKD